jgi:hypothetical protein
MAMTLAVGIDVKIAKAINGSNVAAASAAEVTAGKFLVTTAASNSADNPTITFDATKGAGILEGDFVYIESGWTELNRRVFKVSKLDNTGASLAAGTVRLLGCDTSNDSDLIQFVPGEGVGKVWRVTSWQSLSQIKSLSGSGGDMQFTNITSLTDNAVKEIPTVRGSTKVEMVVYDDPKLSWMTRILEADRRQIPAPFQMVFPSGTVVAGMAYWNIAKIPDIVYGEVVTAKLTLTYLSDPTRA